MIYDRSYGFLRVAYCYALRFNIVLVLTVALAACQTDGGPSKLSLEQARNVTAGFSGSLAPPPRSINDALALFAKFDFSTQHCSKETTPTDEEIRRTMLNLPPARVGNFRRVKYLAQTAQDQFYRGNYPRSVKLMKWAINEVPSDLKMGIARYQSLLALYEARAGDFEAADRSISDAGSNLAEARDFKGSRLNLALTKFTIKEGQAAIAASTGDLAESETHYRRAMEIYRSESIPYAPHIGFTRLALARNLSRQGRLMEAENLVREVVSGQPSEPHDSLVSPTAMALFSEVLYEQGRFEDAEAAAKIAIKIYRAICIEPENLQYAATRNVLAKALIAQERWQEAVAQYDAIRVNMAADMPSFRRLFAGNPYRALAMLRSGRTDEAVKNLRLALERTEKRFGSNNYQTAEIRGFLAMLRLASGDRERALAEFADAVKVLLNNSRESDDEGSTVKARDRRLNLILGAYIGLLADIEGTELAKKVAVGPVVEAFRLAEVPRLRSVQRALTASSARSGLKKPELVDLARREQDAQKQIAVLYGTLATEQSRPIEARNSALQTELKVRIDKLRGARVALMAEIEKRFPDYAQLINPKPLTTEQARAVLRPGEALIATYVGEERTYVWAIPKRGEVSFAAVDIGREELEDTVEWLRAALEPNATTLGDIPDLDLGVAHALYKKLLEPVKAGWRDAESLLVVAHGALGYLPLSLLPTGPAKLGPEKGALFANYRDVPWLVRTHAVTMLPSVASLKTLRGLPPGPAGRKAFVGFGDPYFSRAQAEAAARETAKPVQVASLAGRGLQSRGLPVRLRAAPATQALDSAELARLPRLPDTADEIRSIAVALKADLTRDVFLGERANEGAVKTLDLSGYKVLAFATHGLVPGDLNGLVQPALALSAPEVAGGKDDGLLTMGEILGLKLNADWVVLSACNTGSGQGAGAEAVSGLGRAFFYAGTRALLVSNWPVETTSAKALTTDLFKRQAADATLTRTQALRAAMLALIDGPGYVDQASGKAVFSYAHPIFWAPFTLIGDGGGARPGA